jgi:hypothetical protein
MSFLAPERRVSLTPVSALSIPYCESSSLTCHLSYASCSPTSTKIGSPRGPLALKPLTVSPVLGAAGAHASSEPSVLCLRTYDLGPW